MRIIIEFLVARKNLKQKGFAISHANRKSLLFSLTLAFLLNGAKALPPDAQALLESLPEKAVTLDVVLQRAIQKSDSFQALKTEELLVDLPKLEAKALTLLRVTATADYIDNQNEPTNPFSFNKQVFSQYSLGLEKRFRSGTSIQTKLEHGKQFFQLPAGAPFTIQPQLYQSIATIGISQSLLKDSFGVATRRKMHAADLASKAQRLQYENKLQSWGLELSQVFFDAWLAKENHRSAIESLDRRQKTLKVTRIRSRRGTSERPDLLQAQAAVTEARLAVADAHLSLQDKWRALVISLKLPEDWIKIDAVNIPMKIGNESLKAKNICERVLKSNEEVPSYDVEALEKATQASLLKMKALKNEKLPSLDLVGSYSLNAVDPNDRSQTVDEVLAKDFPAWSVGLRVSYPIGSPAESAAYTKALVEHSQTQNKLQEAKDQMDLTWLSLCDRLDIFSRKTQEFKEATDQQSQRERLESKRFNLGRVSLLNVIQSGDDYTRSRQNLIMAQAGRELTSLQILSIDRQLYTRIERVMHEKND